MSDVEYVALAYAIAFLLLGGYAIHLWILRRQLRKRP
jgi:hypothetical protein